jgi:hypothetical protein
MSAFQNGSAPARIMDDESDVEEEALVADYQEQVQYEDGMDELEPTMSMAQQTDDIQSRLAAAAQPLDFSASLEVKFTSYDNYCSLFHFILNSDGPVDLEPPSVGISSYIRFSKLMNSSTIGLGMLSTSLYTSSTTSAHIETKSHVKPATKKKFNFCEKIRIHGDATVFSMSCIRSFSDHKSTSN